MSKGADESRKQVSDLQKNLERMGTIVEMIPSIVQRLDECVARVEKSNKQAEDNRLKSVSQPTEEKSHVLTSSRHQLHEIISQIVPQIVYQTVNRVGHQYPSQS
jgi:anion-transporting  ArsA/GET3 family ATPase